MTLKFIANKIGFILWKADDSLLDWSAESDYKEPKL